MARTKNWDKKDKPAYPVTLQHPSRISAFASISASAQDPRTARLPGPPLLSAQRCTSLRMISIVVGEESI